MAYWSPLVLIYVPICLLCLWPLVDRLLADTASPLLKGLTAASLSMGAVTFILFWLGLLPGSWITHWTGFLVPLVLFAAGVIVNPTWFKPRRWLEYWRAIARRFLTFSLEACLYWALLAVAAIVLINAFYYPFIGDDVLIRYGPQAKSIYQSGRLPNSLWGYPPLVPLLFVETWFGAGGPNEHLARLVIAAIGIALLAATYLLGRETVGRRGGLLAAVYVGITPMFVDNATLAYTDIPATFPMTLAVLFVVRWWKAGRKVDGLLAGLLTGVAIFTKQSALAWLPGLGVVSTGWLIATHNQPHTYRWRRAFSGLGLLLLPALLVGAPWYVRNALIKNWGSAVPIAGEFHLLGEGVGWLGMVPPLTAPADFGWVPVLFYGVGWIIGFVGVGRAVAQAVRGNITDTPVDLLFSAFIIPYWLAWWQRFSFSSRFLLLILPMMAIWAARTTGALIDQIAACKWVATRWVQLAGALGLLALVAWGSENRLGGVYRQFTQPFAPDTVRWQQAKGEMADLVIYVRENFDPDKDRIWLMDSRMAYYLDDFEITVGYPLTLNQLEGYDYIVHISSIFTVYSSGRFGWKRTEFFTYAFDDRVFESVYVSHDVHIMKILRTTPPPPDGA